MVRGGAHSGSVDLALEWISRATPRRIGREWLDAKGAGVELPGETRTKSCVGIPHQTDKEIEKICAWHGIEPGDFDKPVTRRYWEDWFEWTGGPCARAYQLLEKIDLGPERNSGPLLEFNEGFRPGDNTRAVNAKDMLSLSLLQARLIDLKLPIKIVEGE